MCGEPIRLILVNCNTSDAVSERLEVVAAAIAAPGTAVTAVTPRFGAPKVIGYYDSLISAAAVLEAMAGWRGRCDAVVMVGFGEHGREGARQLMDVPVVDITEAAMMTACLVGSQVGILATSELSVGPIRDSVATMGLSARLAGIVVADDVVWVDQELPSAFAAAGERLLAAGADVIALAGAGMVDVQRLLSARLGVPVVDGLAAAVTQCEALVRLSLTTSKRGQYRWPADKVAHLAVGIG